MPMTTTSGLVNFEMTINRRTASASRQELIETVVYKARKTDWDAVIARADRAISIAGAAAIIVSILYFVPIVTGILSSHP